MKNLNAFDRLARLFLAAVFAFSAWTLFMHPVARLASAAFALFCLYEAVTARCGYQARVCGASNVMPNDTRRLLALSLMQAALAYEWLTAAAEKLSSPAFVAGLPGTLAAFASKNPYAWYASFLSGAATANATAFGYAVEWSQLAIGLALGAAALAIVCTWAPAMRRPAMRVSSAALLGGMLMNVNFYLAAGWMNPGTHGVNLLMFWFQAALVYVWIGETAA